MLPMVVVLLVSMPGQMGFGDEGYSFQPGTERMVLDYVDPYEYTIGTGDYLWISIAGGIPFLSEGMGSTSLLNLPVTIDGNIVIPSIAAVPVAGLSLADAKDEIVSAINYYFIDIDVSVGLSSPASFRIPVSGQVMSPGIISINGITRLSQILEMAGGISPAGSWSSVMILRGDGDTTCVDISDFVLNGNLQSNPLLVRSDRVHVPMATEFVEIEGEVYLTGAHSAGSGSSRRAILEYIPDEHVNEFLMRAGGFTALAFRELCYIERTVDGNTVIIPAELDNDTVDPVLLPGDRLVVPGADVFVFVVGNVERPGSYPYITGRNILYYISQAGGFTNAARRGGVKVTLINGVELDADDVSTVLPGSVINVPRKVLVWWEDYLAVATGLASVFIAYKSIF